MSHLRVSWTAWVAEFLSGSPALVALPLSGWRGTFSFEDEMSVLMHTFRSQFFKHLAYTTSSSIPRIHHLTSHSTFPFPLSSSSALYERRDQCYGSKLNPVAAKFSTFSKTSSSASPYLSIKISCPRDVVVSPSLSLSHVHTHLCQTKQIVMNNVNS